MEILYGGEFWRCILGERNRRVADWLVVLATVFLMFAALPYLGILNQIPYWMGGLNPDSVIGIALMADGLTGLLLVVVNLISCMVAIYSTAYMEKYTAKTKYNPAIGCS